MINVFDQDFRRFKDDMRMARLRKSTMEVWNGSTVEGMLTYNTTDGFKTRLEDLDHHLHFPDSMHLPDTYTSLKTWSNLQKLIWMRALTDIFEMRHMDVAVNVNDSLYSEISVYFFSGISDIVALDFRNSLLDVLGADADCVLADWEGVTE